MTLKEKITDEYIWTTEPIVDAEEVSESVDKMIEIAEEFAIEFAEWCDNEGYTQVNNLSLWKSLDDEKGKYSKELLEIYKQEKES
jgi:hypothetical protein